MAYPTETITSVFNDIACGKLHHASFANSDVVMCSAEHYSILKHAYALFTEDKLYFKSADGSEYWIPELVYSTAVKDHETMSEDLWHTTYDRYLF